MLLNQPHTFFAFIDWGAYVPSIIAAIGGGGFLAAVVLLIKARPEIGQIVVTSSERALIVQTGVLDNLNRELKRVNDENQRLLVKLNAETAEREKVQNLLKEQTAVVENLRRQLTDVETKLKALTQRTTAIENK